MLGYPTLMGGVGRSEHCLAEASCKAAALGAMILITKEGETELWPAWVHGHFDVDVAADPMCSAGQ